MADTWRFDPTTEAQVPRPPRSRVRASSEAEPPLLALRKADVARSLSVSVRTVERLIQAKQLRAVRVGGVLLVPMTELQRLLSDGGNGPQFAQDGQGGTDG